ncbi:hypothetical protein PSCICO_45800 [Pseudomonas cichorii]|uniref:hypothetical protein n=1 Tax=Pseudomonas cichorii TaxID=36746 RepID=UPI0019100958|nr:hypothetical protein [Pseudomonas cichorii]GFM89181.1 hypothetical protein PSCICO_45800 [Pseudomonas cichorii]
MTRLSKEIAFPPEPQPKMKQISFGGSGGGLFTIASKEWAENEDLPGALDLAADLADGVEQLCGRLNDCINNGEIAYCAEIRAIGFLAQMTSALVRSAERGIRKSTEFDQ